MKLEFHKYEGAGNDFIVIDGRGGERPEAWLAPEGIRALCDRHTGVGADGLMVLRTAENADFAMEYYNADGSQADMCGNGGRCIALFARHLGMISGRTVFSGRDGLHEAVILDPDGDGATVELGMTDVRDAENPDGAFFLNTGVPHYVEFVEDTDGVDVVARGRRIRFDDRFAPEGTNVNFVEELAPGRIAVRTYERGVEDETCACGTGAVASAIATHLRGQRSTTEFSVAVLGGELVVSFEPEDGRFGNVRLTGPARRVFSGTIEVDA